MEPRFRWTTLHRALDVLVQHCTSAQMKSLIEEVGCGPELDRTPATEQSTPKLKNLLSRLCRQDPPRLDPEGDLLSNRLVREAAARVLHREARPWHDDPAGPEDHDTAFERAVAVDGWLVRDKMLVPAAPVPLEPAKSRLRGALEARGAAEALSRLDQLEKGLDEGHWESANSDARGFLASVFDVIAAERIASAPRDGAARKALQGTGFFRPDPRNPSNSFEGKFVSSLIDLLGSAGAHTGTSDGSVSVYRYGLCVLTADHFLSRSK